MLAHQNDKSEEVRLKKRTGYFFRADARARQEVAAFARQLGDLGTAAVIGGMLRDLYLEGNERFTSDVDFVVECNNGQELDRFVQRFDAKRNRFGGYSIKLSKWAVDVWALDRTWAAVEGHVRVNTLQDLLSATFFDCDAILYRLDNQSIVARDGYFERLKSRLIEINLAANPNPLGNSVRALRYSCRWGARLGPRLARHVCDQIRSSGWDGLLRYEYRSFATQMLRTMNADAVLALLDEAERLDWTTPVELYSARVPRQLSLKLMAHRAD